MSEREANERRKIGKGPIYGLAHTAVNPTSAVRHDFHLIWPIWSTNRVCFLCLDLLGGRVVPTYPLD